MFRSAGGQEISAIQHDSGRDFKYIFVKMLYLQSRIYML